MSQHGKYQFTGFSPPSWAVFLGGNYAHMYVHVWLHTHTSPLMQAWLAGVQCSVVGKPKSPLRDASDCSFAQRHSRVTWMANISTKGEYCCIQSRTEPVGTWMLEFFKFLAARYRKVWSQQPWLQQQSRYNSTQVGNGVLPTVLEDTVWSSTMSDANQV